MAEVQTYPFRTVLAACAVTSLLTVAAGIAIGPAAYTKFRLAMNPPKPPLQGPGAEFSNPDIRNIARKKWQSILDGQANLISPQTARDFYSGWLKLEIWRQQYYLGIRIQKYPNDLWMLQQILYEVRPDYIIETGTFDGGSALFMAHVLDGLDLSDSRIITIDINNNLGNVSKRRLWQKYVEFVQSDSTDPATVAKIRKRVQGRKVLVTLDSLHKSRHVSAELKLYSPLVSQGSYLIVEDTHIDGFPADPAHGPGPMDAVTKFLASAEGKKFQNDRLREALIITQNRGGWLQRMAE